MSDVERDDTSAAASLSSLKHYIKAVFHCSRFARAGGASKFQLLLWVSNLSVFCQLLCARTRLEVELNLTFLAYARD